MQLQTLPGQVWDKTRRIWWQAAFMRAYMTLINDGKASTADKLEQAMLKLSRPEDGQEFLASLRQVSALQEMFKRRYIPPKYTLEELKDYPKGSFGYAYYRHMTDNGLGIDYYSVPDPSDDMAYFRMRLVQSHDMWHTLLGFPPTPLGERGIIAFNLGHYYRYLGAAAPKAMVLLSVITSAGIFRHATRHTENLPEMFNVFSQGWLMGQEVDFLIPGEWESFWARPLEELRRQYHIKPFSTIYDFTSLAEETQAGESVLALN